MSPIEHNISSPLDGDYRLVSFVQYPPNLAIGIDTKQLIWVPSDYNTLFQWSLILININVISQSSDELQHELSSDEDFLELYKMLSHDYVVRFTELRPDECPSYL